MSATRETGVVRMAKACGLDWRKMGVLVGVLACVSTAWGAETPTVDELMREAEPRALQVILDATNSEEAELRANAVEAAQAMPGRALPIAQIALEDPNAAVRFTALVTIGKLGLEPLGDASLRMTRDSQPFVRAAALYAAKRCGKRSTRRTRGALGVV